jgi:hypothetical protein
MRSNLEQTLDCEKAWDDYIAPTVTSLSRSFPNSRFIRINPDIGEVPALDDKDKMASRRTKTRVARRVDGRILNIAKQPITSSLYFHHLSMSDLQLVGIHQVQGNQVVLYDTRTKLTVYRQDTMSALAALERNVQVSHSPTPPQQ